MADEQDSVEVNTPAGNLRVRGTDMVALMTCVFVGIGAFALWQHENDAHMQQGAFLAAIKDLTDAQRESVRQQKFLTCIVSRPESERKVQFELPNSMCRQVVQ